MADGSSDGTVGFPASYRIGNQMGGPIFTVHLYVYPPQETLTGAGEIKSDDGSPRIDTWLEGSYSHVVVDGQKRIVMSLTGHPGPPPPKTAMIVTAPNVYLHIVLDEGWIAGTGSYKYTHDGEHWKSWRDAPLGRIPASELQPT